MKPTRTVSSLGVVSSKGQHLGTVAEPSAYYVKEGANLYFKLTKDGIPVNPMDYFE